MVKFKELWKEEFIQKFNSSITEKEMVELGISNEDIESLLDEMYDEYINRDENKCSIILYNNVENTAKRVRIEALLDFIVRKEPITTEHGCMFANHNQALNRQAKLLEFISSSRAAEKKLMLMEKAKGEDADPVKIKKHNSNQLAFKRLGNSYYGITGLKSSIFFNKHVALSITGKGRSIISTAFTTFENFLGDDILFNTLEELSHYINIIINEDHKKGYSKKFINNNKTRKEVYQRLLNKLSFQPTDIEKEIIKGYISNVKSQHILNKLYYKNNIYEIIRNDNVMAIYDRIINSDVDFMDPNEVPEELKEDMDTLWSVMHEFCLVEMVVLDKMEKLQHKERSIVLGVDTDSNFLNIGPMVNFLDKELDIRITENKEIKIVNTTAFLLSNAIKTIYWLYTGNCNVPEFKRSLIRMKNEFCWSRVMFTNNKKSYASNTLLQEGVMIPQSKSLDIKGLQIKKSNVNEEVSMFLTNILEFDILKSDEIDVNKIYDKLEELELIIVDSIKNKKETKFATPASVKSASDYVDPFRQASFKAATMWNELNPEDPIILPNNVNIFKLTGSNLEDIEIIKDDYPEMYEKIKERIFEDETLSKYGLEAIAIPNNIKTIPDWIVPLVDVNSIVRDNISVFTPVLNSINLKTLSIGDNNYFSNIIEI